eukprot:2465169-Pleurochrysis_carterae.AAC.1
MPHSNASMSRSLSSDQMFTKGSYGQTTWSSDSLNLGSAWMSCSRSSSAFAAPASSPPLQLSHVLFPKLLCRELWL